MSLRQLDHVNIRTARLDALTRFYVDALGMTVGPRPAFSFPGAWLYCGDRAVVHLVGVAAPPAPTGELRLEHFAFAADDVDGVRARLDAAGVSYRLDRVDDFALTQIHLRDPDGNHIHIDFRDR